MDTRSIVAVLLVLLVAASAARTKKPKAPKGVKKLVQMLVEEVAYLKEVVGHSESGYEHSDYFRTERPECPDGWTKMHGSCLKLLTEPASFNDSQTACSDLGAHLAIPRSAAEQQFINSLTSNTSKTWLGVVRDEHDNASFVDVKGMELFFENWYEPNNEPNNEFGNENCVELYPNGFWNDKPCSVENEALCQKLIVKTIIDRQIVFERSFTAPPNVILSVNKMDAWKEANLRYNLRAIGVTRDGFRMQLRAWGTTHLYQANVEWLAVPDVPGIL